MHRCAIGLAAGVALTLATFAVSSAQKAPEDPGVNAARAEILAKVAPRGGKPKLDDLVLVYKRVNRGGLGFGPQPNATSGMETKIIDLSRAAPSKVTVKMESDDLIKLAHRMIAMADLVRPHFTKPMGGKGKKDWDQWLDDQKVAAKELIRAVENEDGKAVTKAAKKLHYACGECHAAFRD